MENNKPTTKVNMDEDKGDGWSKIANVSQLTHGCKSLTIPTLAY